MTVRDSFRKISKGGSKSTSENILGRGGHTYGQYSILKGYNSQGGGGGHKVFKGGQMPPPPLNETLTVPGRKPTLLPMEKIHSCIIQTGVWES